ncbi:MAG: ATP-binding protein [Kineosporiaceae bacterium]
MAGEPDAALDHRALGRLLREQREQQGLSQERLAEKAGLSVRTVRNLEFGRGRPHQTTLERLLTVLTLDGGTTELLTSNRRTRAVEPGPASPVQSTRNPPAELPADVFAFTGRASQLQILDEYFGPELHDDDGSSAPAVPRPPLALLVGLAGVGKTSLAIHWAHHASGRWPDGQLFVDLRGYDPLNPLRPEDALAHVLRGLDIPEQTWPSEPSERAALFRSAVARSRMLLVLDNCASAEQVRPLLPGTPASAVLVTSRRSLPGLVARDGARRVRLDALERAEAVLLLRRLVDDEGPSADLAELADLCDRLPLALRVAAELVGRRAPSSVKELVAELRVHRSRLARLSSTDDHRTDLATVFSWSLKHLPDPARDAFVALGLYPGPTFDAHVLSVLTQNSVDRAQAAIQTLEDAHLALPAGHDRYRMHDLVREYANSLTPPTAADRSAAAQRLMSYVVDRAGAAVDTLNASARRAEYDVTPRAVAFQDAAEALAWLAAERDNIESVVRVFADDEPLAAIDLSRRLFRYLAGNAPRLAVTVHRRALEAAEALHDSDAVVTCLHNLGTALWQCGDTQPARASFLRALDVARASADLVGEGQTLLALGRCEQTMTAAIEWFTAALEIFTKVGDLNGQARSLANLGFAAERLGNLTEALGHLSRAADLAAASNDLGLEANIVGGLGEIARKQGDQAFALHHHQRALEVFQRLGDRERSAWAWHGVATDLRETGDLAAATLHDSTALELFEELGDPTGRAHALNGLGETLLAADAPSDARDYFQRALDLGDSVADRDQLARAHAGVMDCDAILGSLPSAVAHGTKAHALYVHLGRPEATEVAQRLGALPKA